MSLLILHASILLFSHLRSGYLFPIPSTTQRFQSYLFDPVYDHSISQLANLVDRNISICYYKTYKPYWTYDSTYLATPWLSLSCLWPSPFYPRLCDSSILETPICQTLDRSFGQLQSGSPGIECAWSWHRTLRSVAHGHLIGCRTGSTLQSKPLSRFYCSRISISSLRSGSSTNWLVAEAVRSRP